MFETFSLLDLPLVRMLRPPTAGNLCIPSVAAGDRLFVPTLRLEEDEAMSRIQTLLSSMTLS
jgi:hypothetical protein